MKLLDCYDSLMETTARSMILFDSCLCGVGFWSLKFYKALNESTLLPTVNEVAKCFAGSDAAG
jgi:hypothetical protein